MPLGPEASNLLGMQKRAAQENGPRTWEGPSDTAMAHLYRGELGRSDRWRTRLDTTSNWALTTTAAVISFSFGAIQTTHVTIVAGMWLVLSFLVIETRRYRYYDLWNRRVRLLEDGYWVPLLRHEPIDPDALHELALEMERPQLQLSFFIALQTRLNRAYGSLLTVLLVAWFVKVYSHPEPARSVGEFIFRAHIGPVSGWLVSAAMVVLSFALAALFVLSRFVRLPMGELRTRPHPRRRSLWESFYRPYATQAPRARERRRTPAA